MNYKVLLNYINIDTEYKIFFNTIEDMLGYYNTVEYQDSWKEEVEYPHYYTIELKLTDGMFEKLSKEFEIIKVKDLD